MTSAQLVETSINVTSKHPPQECTHPDDNNLRPYQARKLSGEEGVGDSVDTRSSIRLFWGEGGEGEERYNVEIRFKGYYISAGQTSLLQVQWKFTLGHTLI